MKPIVFDNPDKMHFESAHKTFNAQTALITTGNAILPTQISYYIRPAQEVMCNGHTWAEGYLQNADLESFSEMGLSRFLSRTKKIINERGKKAILYYFFHRTNDGRRIDDGLLLTTGPSENYQELHRWYLNTHWRARDAFEEAIRYVTNPKEEERERDKSS